MATTKQLAFSLKDSMSLEDVKTVIQSRKLRLSPKQISAFLGQLSKLGRPMAAWNVMQSFKQLRVATNEIHQNIVFSATARASHWPLALHLLDTLDADVIGVSSAMEAFGCASRWQMAVELLSSAQKRDLNPDVVMVSTAIKACDAGRTWQCAVNLLELMQDWHLRSNQIIYTNLISACASCGQWSGALSLLHSMSTIQVTPNVVTCTAALGAYVTSGYWHGALQLLRSMVGIYNVQPSTATYNAAIKVCAVGGHWQVALSLYSEMCEVRQDLPPNALTFTSLFSSLGNSKEWPAACALMDGLRSKNHNINTITWNSFINALSSGSQWQSALEALFNAPGGSFDSTGFHAVIRAADLVLEWQLAVGLLGEMLGNRVEPCLLCWSSTMRACRDRWEVTLNLLACLSWLKLTADATAYTAAITACGRAVKWQVCLEIAQSMPEESENSITFGALCTTLSAAGLWQSVFLLLEDMLTRNINGFQESKYDHIVQAGSSLDCFKHSVLVVFLQHFCADPEPFLFVDTHAGRGIYDLAEGTLNYQRGINLLQGKAAESSMASLAQYMAAVKRSGGARYPGSAALAASWLRPQDRALFFEISKDMSIELAKNVHGLERSGGPSIEVMCRDSYSFLLRMLAPVERSLVLVDPPCEPYDLYMAWSLHLMAHAADHWPSCTVIVWYPCLDEQQLSGLYQQAGSLGLQLLVAEFAVQTTQLDALEKSGVFILNPSARLVGVLKDLLAELSVKFEKERRDANSVDATCFWLSGENIAAAVVEQGY